MDQTEVGRIFSCLALVSALVQFVSGPMYAVIYNQTLDTFPGTFMLTTSLIIFVAMVITVLVKCIMSKGQLKILVGYMFFPIYKMVLAYMTGIQCR